MISRCTLTPCFRGGWFDKAKGKNEILRVTAKLFSAGFSFALRFRTANANRRVRLFADPFEKPCHLRVSDELFNSVVCLFKLAFGQHGVNVSVTRQADVNHAMKLGAVDVFSLLFASVTRPRNQMMPGRSSDFSFAQLAFRHGTHVQTRQLSRASFQRQKPKMELAAAAKRGVNYALR